MGQAQIDYVSIEEYLAMDQTTVEKHEYTEGIITAMSGGTLAHATLGSNATYLLNSVLDKKGKNCLVTNSEMRVYVERATSFVYPDALMLCGEPEFYEGKESCLCNPTLIIEVLSESTERYDRGAKFRKYCSLPSFKEYVLIDQYQPIVDVLYRENPGAWVMRTTIGLDKEIHLHTVDANISMSKLYKNIHNLGEPNFRLEF